MNRIHSFGGGGDGWLLAAAMATLLETGCSGAKQTACTGADCGKAPVAYYDRNQAPNTAVASPANDDLSNLRVVNAPDWITSGGNSRSYPNEAFLTGIAVARGDDAMKRAMADAAADLANRISVHIEHELTDVNSEKNGKVDYHIAAITKLTSDVRIQGLKYEIAHRGTEVYALAYVNRADAATERRMLLERSLLVLRGCMKSAREQKAKGGVIAADEYLRCLQYVSEGLQHDAVVRTVDPKSGQKPQRELVQDLQEIRSETTAVAAKPASTLKEAADFLALQFRSQKALPYMFRDSPSFRYGVTNFSSSLGQQLGIELENALARRISESDTTTTDPKDAVIRGVYFEEGASLRISATVVEVATGKIVGGAETTIPQANLPAGIVVLPKNLETAMEDQKLLSKGELVDGKLRVEVWADKGRRGVVYSESEQIRLFMRVNAPAYVRLIYVLESGVQVPIDQAYYIDSSKVNMAVEYPNRFEVAPPFGVEAIHATAFTKQPAPLAVATKVIAGEPYTIIEDGLSSMVRHRGIQRVEKDEFAESLLAITTLPIAKTAQR